MQEHLIVFDQEAFHVYAHAFHLEFLWQIQRVVGFLGIESPEHDGNLYPGATVEDPGWFAFAVHSPWASHSAPRLAVITLRSKPYCLFDYSSEQHHPARLSQLLVDETVAAGANERFQETITAFGQYEGFVYDLLLYAIDNEIHHRGQGYVYLRALGIAPPPFYER